MWTLKLLTDQKGNETKFGDVGGELSSGPRVFEMLLLSRVMLSGMLGSICRGRLRARRPFGLSDLLTQAR